MTEKPPSTLEGINAAVNLFLKDGPSMPNKPSPPPVLAPITGNEARVMTFIATHGLHGESYVDLGAKLNMSPGDVMLALEELKRLGYLRDAT